ncbi:unnamed protein product (macronuclear) [Paramecium tetraurelia]|uniref:Cyclic nucleotide-binding domain-containing protein n=1 Tax=Paramecium tetraurelia TaxID=5888 RepID=A0E7L3_PARTE|nr:uncharacterized protein GSPATT00024008001 [Paramecium tetraurelia]CAK91280.1 unnamed protein product [Paramecium tetraurelia]|eukprot:XP_001458677.1 hypothetical protein (macronuclear) [Paramecium tetraurelia strain d4-2]
MKKRTSSAFSDALNIMSIAKFLHKTTYQHDISQIKDSLIKDPFSRNDQDIQSLYEFIYVYNYIQRLKSKYSDQFVREICRYIYYKQVSQNTIINTHKTVFLVLSGRVVVTYYDDNEDGDQHNGSKSISQELTFGMSFNDYGLSENRKCHVRVIRPTEFACLDFKIFNEINSNQRSNDTYEKQKFLKSLSFFSIFSDVEIKYFSYHMEQSIVQKNSYIYQENDESIEFCYFIGRGEMEIYKQNTQRKQFCLTKLLQGEFFGEDGLFLLNKRQFSAKCSQDNTLLYRISLQEFDKRIWKKEQRRWLFELLNQKWIFRFQRFYELTQMNMDKELLSQQIKNLSQKLNQDEQPKIDLEFEENQNQMQTTTAQEQFITASWLLKSANQAQQILQNFRQKTQNKDEIKQITSVSPKYQLQLERIKAKSKYTKSTKTNFSNRQSIIKANQSPYRISSFHNKGQGKVASNMSYLKLFNQETERLNLEQQLTQYLDKIGITDENMLEIQKLSGSATDRYEKNNQFYQTMETYAQFQLYKNLNLQESKSQHAKNLEVEYQQLVQDQQTNIKKAFEQLTTRKSDNMIRKEFFLNKLKKMNKRLKVLELIQKGQLECKATQMVDEDGEIVDIDEPIKPDEAYDIIDGKRVRKFNFVTSEVFEQFEKNKFHDFKQQIDQQKQKIQVIKEIVSGKLPISAANDDCQQIQNRTKPTNSFRPSSSVKQVIPFYILQQKQQSTSYKLQQANYQASSLISTRLKM